ncbi:XRE family transcriptional regulator [Actinokineospora guangxiensis]|uniref:XRE family transcriptional regulator n=1 Tax=Actinokineospora guangxiensis TaxID=1490288 RepID=A0ABW0EI06_9PSEU
MPIEDRELADVLATGPFEVALRTAIHRSGLSLERVRAQLARHGCPVSVAALSHWQSGRSRPERRESLVALGVLEDVLAVPGGALVGLLGAPRPRGRRRRSDLPLEAVWPGDAAMPDLLGRVDTGHDRHLTRLSQHDLVRIGPDRTERLARVRQVLRAERAGLREVLVAYGLDTPHRAGPRLRPLRHCQVARSVYDPTRGKLVAALSFDRELARGEAILVEYEIHCPPTPTRATCYERKLRYPVRDMHVEVVFDRTARPTRCQWEHRTPTDTTTRPLRLDTSHTTHSHSAQATTVDAEPGRYLLRWDW